jgi:hypothetical protein
VASTKPHRTCLFPCRRAHRTLGIQWAKIAMTAIAAMGTSTTSVPIAKIRISRFDCLSMNRPTLRVWIVPPAQLLRRQPPGRAKAGNASGAQRTAGWQRCTRHRAINSRPGTTFPPRMAGGPCSPF